ncbi:unnamed protein product [Closterium sp. NIES-54]
MGESSSVSRSKDQVVDVHEDVERRQRGVGAKKQRRVSSGRRKPKSRKRSPQCVVPLTWRLAETVDWPPEAPLGTRRKRPGEARWAAQPDLLVQTAL